MQRHRLGLRQGYLGVLLGGFGDYLRPHRGSQVVRSGICCLYARFICVFEHARWAQKPDLGRRRGYLGAFFGGLGLLEAILKSRWVRLGVS